MNNKQTKSARKRENKRTRVGGQNSAPSSAMQIQGNSTTGIGHHIGAALGGALAGPAGAALGAALGGGAQSLLTRLVGFGDYQVSNNSLMGGGLPIKEVVSSSLSNRVLIRKCEYIADVLGTTAFTNTTYSINPGLSTFPWVSQVAQAFEQYCVRGMVFEFRSESSDAVLSSATNSALGYVAMATEYNTLRSSFIDKQSMLGATFSNSSKPSVNLLHPIECAGDQTPVCDLYVRTGDIATGSDQRLYDLGNFQIATGGQQASGGVLGELWVCYEIEFFKPIVLEVQGYEIRTDHYQLATVSASAPLGTASNLETGSSIGGVINAAGTRYTFPASVTSGNYLVLYSIFGTGAAITNPAFTATNGSFLTIWENDGHNSLIITNGTTTPLLITAVILSITSATAYIAVGTAGTIPSTITAGDLWVTQVNESILTKISAPSTASRDETPRVPSDLGEIGQWCKENGITNIESEILKKYSFLMK